MTQPPPPRTAADIRTWLLATLADRMRIDPQRFRADRPIDEQGVDSMQVVVLVGLLEEWLGVEIVENPLPAHPSVDALARFLADEIAAGKTVIRSGE